MFLFERCFEQNYSRDIKLIGNRIKRRGVQVNYFYAYLNDDKTPVLSQIDFNKIDIGKDDIYIDSENLERWNSLKPILKNQDTLYIYDITWFADNANQLKEKLSFLFEKSINLKLLDGVNLNVQQLLNTVDFVKTTLNKYFYGKQMEGIQRALEKKKKGEGNYGRPKIILPEDFEDKIKKIMKKEMKHEDYRAQLGYKRSTYFKFVKEVKESWKKQ